MPITFIALLRAVNVATTWIKMADLTALASSLGFANIRTYIQSGNLVFTSKDPAVTCRGALAKALENKLGKPISVIVKDINQLATVVAGNPFLGDPAVDPTKLHVTFLGEPPTKAALAKLAAIKSGVDGYRSVGDVVYIHCPVKYGETKLSNAAIEKALGVKATTRKWQTVLTLLEMASS